MTDKLSALADIVDQYPADFTKVIKDYERKEPRKVKTSMSGKYQRIEVEIEPEIFLTVYQTRKDGVKEAWYVAFDHESSTCYKRSL